MAKSSGLRVPTDEWPLVGRDDERAYVLDALRPGKGGILIAGAPGVGKSRLARDALASVATTPGCWVEWVLATRASASIPLGAFAHLVFDADPPRPADRLSLFRLMAQRLRARAGDRRLILAVDDAHTLDPASAALVHFLGTRGVATVVLTARSGEPWPDAITALWKDGHVERLDIHALAEAEIGELLEASLDGPASRTCRRWAFENSDGYPLFLRELITESRRARTLHQKNGLWQPPEHTHPVTRVSELVQTRLTTITDRQRYALEVVALGEPVSSTILAQMVPSPDALALESAGLITARSEDGGLEVRLTHPLYGEVVTHAIPPLRASRIRRSLADAAEAHSPEPQDPLRVVSWRLDAGDHLDDARLLVAAAAQAESRFDLPLTERIARLAVAAGGGLPAVLLLARSLRAQNKFADADELLSSVEVEARASTTLAPHYLFLRVSTLLWGLGRPDLAEELLHQAAGWSPDARWRHVVTGEQVLLWSITGDLDRAATAGLDLLAEAELADHVRVSTAVATAFSLAYLGRGREALASLDDVTGITTVGTTSEWPPDAMWAQVAITCGIEWDDAQHRLSRLHDDAVQSGNDALISWVEMTIGWAALHRGDVSSARRWLGDAVSGMEQADPRGMLPSCLAILSVAEAAAGRGPEARTAIDRAVSARGPHTVFWLVDAELAEADVWAMAATGAVTRAGQLALDTAQRYARYPTVRGDLLHLALRLGAEPAPIADELGRMAERVDSPLLTTSAAHARALADADAPGVEHAARDFATIGALARAADAAADAAAVYAQSGRGVSARAVTAYSQTLAARCTGAQLWNAPAIAPVVLSRREREVAVLAARGLSNAEIAALLTLSVRTVESHLYRAATKLGVSHREELGPLIVATTPARRP